MTPVDFFERYASQIMPEPNSGCWLWIGSRTSSGYGNIRIGDRNTYAHRLAYEAANGTGSAAGSVIRHKCDTPCCCNPDHLVSGTHKDNSRDAWSRGRMRPTFGERSGRAVLSDADVVAARDLARSGHPLNFIANKYSASRNTIEAAIRGQTWKHLPGAVAEIERQRDIDYRHRRGESSPLAILTAEAVEDVRSCVARGEKQTDLARRYCVSPATINCIVKGRTWKR